MNALIKPKLSLEACLAREEDQPAKHGFHRGEMVETVGAKRVPGRVVGNVERELGILLMGATCRTFHEDMEVRVADDTVLHPDVCSGIEPSPEA